MQQQSHIHPTTPLSPREVHASPAKTHQHEWFTFLNLCRVMRIVGFMALTAIIAIIIMAIHSLSTLPTAADEWTVILALVFNLLLSFLLILAMFEVRMLIRRIFILSSWFFLGLTQCYLAVQVASTITNRNMFDNSINYGMRGVSLTLFIVGFLFVVLGAIGGKQMKTDREAAERRSRIEKGEVVSDGDFV